MMELGAADSLMAIFGYRRTKMAETAKELPELINDNGLWVDRLGQVNDGWRVVISCPIPHGGGYHTKVITKTTYAELNKEAREWLDTLGRTQ